MENKLSGYITGQDWNCIKSHGYTTTLVLALLPGLSSPPILLVIICIFHRTADRLPKEQQKQLHHLSYLNTYRADKESFDFNTNFCCNVIVYQKRLNYHTEECIKMQVYASEREAFNSKKHFVWDENLPLVCGDIQPFLLLWTEQR